MKVLILFDHIREEHFSVSKDGSVKSNVLNTPNGKTLKKLLEKCSNLKRDKTNRDYDIDFLYNAVPTPIRNDYGKIIKYQDVKQAEVKPYYERMNNIIIDNSYDMVIPVGKLGVKYLLNVTAIGKVRGVPSKVTIENGTSSHDVWVLPTYSIEYTNVNKNSERHVVSDLQTVGKFVEQGEEAFKPKEVSYELVDNIERVREIFNKEVKNDNYDGVDITAWDLETNSLKPDKEGSKPLVLSLSWRNGQGVTIPLYKSDFNWENGQDDIDEVLELLKNWLASKEDIKVAHNGKYDIKFLMSTENFKDFESIQDTKVGWYLAVTQEVKESLRLSDLAYEVTDVGGYDKPLEDFKLWFVTKLLRFFSDKIKEIQKENKKIAKKEYDVKAPEYKEWLENKLNETVVELDDTEKKFRVSELEKKYIQLGLSPEIVNMNLVMDNDEFINIAEQSPEYMGLSDYAKSYTLNTAINLINEYRDVKDVVNDIDGGNFNYDWFPIELMHPYASGDTDVCRRIYCDVIKKLKEQDRPKSMHLLEVNYPRLTKSLARIESNGLYCDLDYMKENDESYESEMAKNHATMREHWAVKEFEEYQYNLYQMALEEHEKKPKDRDKDIHQYRDKFKDGKWMFSPSSGDHKGRVIYDILGIQLPYDKEYVKEKPFNANVKEADLTWQDYKTDKKAIGYALDNLELKDDVKELLELLKYHASMQTKRNSFTKKLLNMINKQKRTLHGSFSETGTETSRLSSSNPNLQNLPAHTSDVNKFDYKHPIKRSFVSRFENGVLLGSDYSALEMRIIGLFTKDPDMLQSFLNGEDIHKATASIVYNKPVEEVTKEERQATKAVNFGLAFGESPFSFAGKNNMEVSEAEEIFEKYFQTKPSVKTSIDNVHEFVQQYGYVDTMHGHRRFIRSAQSTDKKIKNEGLRQSFNTIIQGSGSFLTNMSLTYLDDFIQSRNLKSKVIATVHDSILIDCPPEEAKIMAKVTIHIMENLPFDFLKAEIDGKEVQYPIEADMEIGLNYNDMVEYDEEEIDTFNSYQGYIKYMMNLQTLEDYKESGKLTDEQFEKATNVVKSEKHIYQEI
ncbi:DNA polymerase I [Staphylococcus phage 812]|uniref:PolA n=11 Tax=Kayvirus G1 TaxID=292029 RepID=I6XE56_9CAUD|nr:PolA [Staphylococcus phage A3R]YP_009781061.1 PolA [Staphylococcus phage 676Z]YP_009781294.1 PolA [Staphylococcus phage Fi200W]YP_009781758.1 PolA [Staphylococcus phage P4W]AZB49852.1 DNA polymerase I [Staphylococcus phage 812]AZB50070.1 DNA polymerase I [Staphylococcus phage 812h1]AFN38171.1 PolA [Staphylococcus phage A3R]AFN38365.1 PolA [Staphylococcus phage 676Z]AFN38577.1 PolA [Staphylococcus phage Fi200W]